MISSKRGFSSVDVRCLESVNLVLSVAEEVFVIYVLKLNAIYEFLFLIKGRCVSNYFERSLLHFCIQKLLFRNINPVKVVQSLYFVF